MNLENVRLHYVCPRCGRKLSKAPAYTYTTNVRRRCPGCRREYSITITPKEIAGGLGWLHVGTITEMPAAPTRMIE